MQQPRALSELVVPLEKLAVQGNDNLMHTKALSIMGPRGGKEPAPIVFTHLGAGVLPSIA